MTARPFKKISVRKTVQGYSFWVGTTMARKVRPSFHERDFDTGLLTLNHRLNVPKRNWYYRVRMMYPKLGGAPRPQPRIERVSMKQEDDLLPWCEAFEVWCTYARML